MFNMERWIFEFLEGNISELVKYCLCFLIDISMVVRIRDRYVFIEIVGMDLEFFIY